MSQLSYSDTMTKSIRGMKADSRFDHVDGTKSAFEALGLGLGVVQRTGYDDAVRLPKYNQSVLLFDADFVSLNTIDLNINGVAVATTTFATDQATTLAALAVNIAAHADVTSATVSAARTITILAVDGVDLLLSGIVVALGASQAGGTSATSSTDTIYGATLLSDDRESARSTGLVQYAQYEPVNVLVNGALNIVVEESVTPQDSVFCRVRVHSTAGITAVGQFRTDAATDGINTNAIQVVGARYAESVIVSGAVGIAKLVFNLPQ